MHLAVSLVLSLLCAGPRSDEARLEPVEVLACRREVYAVGEAGGHIFAATSAGVVDTLDGHVYRTVGAILPGRVRQMDVAGGRLVASDAEGRSASFDGVRWADVAGKTVKKELPAMSAPPGSGGAFLSAVSGDGGAALYSFWGAKSLYRKRNDSWERAIERPPAAGDYNLAEIDSKLLAATSDGLWSWDSKTWSRIDLPHGLPIVRVHGLARTSAGSLMVGGPDGLWLRDKGGWRSLSQEPVRRIVGAGAAVWVVYGSGAADKLESDRDRLLSDVLMGAVRRPWCSALSVEGDRVLFGLNGGWVERAGGKQQERYLQEMAGDVVTAFASDGTVRFVGTQKNGLFAVNGAQAKRIGPAQGLPDTWVTALQAQRKNVFVGTAAAGLWEVHGAGVRAVPCPTTMISALTVWGDSLVVGGAHGAWMRTERGWIEFNTDGQETCAFSVDCGSLWVLTPTGAYRFTNTAAR